MSGESIITRDAYPRLRPPGRPVLGQYPVLVDQPAYVPDPLRYSGFASDVRGGPGATVDVVHWPGPPPSATWDFIRAPRARARDRHAVGTPGPGPWPQTPSAQVTAEVASAGAPPEPGPIEVLEVV